jgi:hypothetical protein
VCAASEGKFMNFAMSVANSEVGNRNVMKLTNNAAKVAKFEFLRKGCNTISTYSKSPKHVSTYSSFYPTLTPRNIHNRRKQPNSTHNPRLKVITSHPLCPQPANDLQRDIRANRMPHQDDTYILRSLLFNLLHQISERIFRVPDLVLQPIRRLFAPFHRLNIRAVHLETR